MSKDLYFLSYDLRQERDYPILWNELKRVGAVRMLKSDWCLHATGMDAASVRDHFLKFIDKNDGLVVSKVEDWATYKAEGDPSKLK